MTVRRWSMAYRATPRFEEALVVMATPSARIQERGLRLGTRTEADEADEDEQSIHVLHGRRVEQGAERARSAGVLRRSTSVRRLSGDDVATQNFR
jgi:hypothetical protein